MCGRADQLAHLVHDVRQRGEAFWLPVGKCEAQRKQFEIRAQQEHVAGLFRVRLNYKCASIRYRDHQALLLEPADGFPDGITAYAESARQLGLNELHAGREVSRENFLANNAEYL